MGKTIDNGRTSRRYKSVTPHDSNALPSGECIAIYVGTGGDVVLVDVDGDPCTFKNVPSGGTILGQTLVVMATGTTATDIVAYY